MWSTKIYFIHVRTRPILDKGFSCTAFRNHPFSSTSVLLSLYPCPFGFMATVICQHCYLIVLSCFNSMTGIIGLHHFKYLWVLLFVVLSKKLEKSHIQLWVNSGFDYLKLIDNVETPTELLPMLVCSALIEKSATLGSASWLMCIFFRKNIVGFKHLRSIIHEKQPYYILSSLRKAAEASGKKCTATNKQISTSVKLPKAAKRQSSMWQV